MSEQSTRLTQELLTTDYALLFEGSSNERWAAQDAMRLKAKELTDNDLVDEGAVIELANHNAEKYHLDTEAADGIFSIAQKPYDGSLMAMHSPSRKVWRGSGSALTTAGPDVVHYISNPGLAESIYGPAFPYVIDKLGWMAIAHDLKGYQSLSNQGGYQYVTNRLHRLGRKGLPHIGPIVISKETVYYPIEEAPKFLISSASGTLVTGWVDETHQRFQEYAERSVIDEANGLFDGHIENRRAGLYDIMFADMIGTILLGGTKNDQMLTLFRPDFYSGVDIN